MPAQQRDARRNYIGIVSDRIEEDSAVESPAIPDRLVRGLLAAVMAVVRKRQRETRD